MSTIFGHQPDGFIYIGTLPPIPLDFYVTRHPDYALPKGAVRREYMAGEYDTITLEDGSDEQREGKWDEGDALVASAEDDVAAYLASLPPPVVEDDSLTDEQKKAIEVEAARTAALRALDDKRIADAAKLPDAPAEVMEYIRARDEMAQAQSMTLGVVRA